MHARQPRLQQPLPDALCGLSLLLPLLVVVPAVGLLGQEGGGEGT